MIEHATLGTATDPIGRAELRRLIEWEHEPAVSIYLPTHRAGAETLQDPIRLKNLIREAERQLESRGEEPPACKSLLSPLRELIDQYEFWQQQSGGLAMFRTMDDFHRYRVPFEVPELAVVGARLHLKPLLPAVELDRRFYLIALSQDRARLFDSSRQGMTEVEIPEMPESSLFSPGEWATDSELQSHTAIHRPFSRGTAIFHGHRSGEDGRKRMLLDYFRRVDEALRKHMGDEKHLPVVLAGVEYLCPIYRQASAIPLILPAEIHGNLASFHVKDVHRMAWDIASRHFLENRDNAVDEYHNLWHTHRVSNDLRVIVKAARRGRVKILFVAVGVQEWGHIDKERLRVLKGEILTKQDEDLLNLAALETFAAGGTVYAVPPAEVPGRRSIAAVFRY